jgi:hypothetical protein
MDRRKWTDDCDSKQKFYFGGQARHRSAVHRFCGSAMELRVSTMAIDFGGWTKQPGRVSGNTESANRVPISAT